MSDFPESGFYLNNFDDLYYDPNQDFPFQDQYVPLGEPQEEEEQNQPQDQEQEQQQQQQQQQQPEFQMEEEQQPQFQDFPFDNLGYYQDPENSFYLDGGCSYPSSGNYSPDSVISPSSTSESGSPGIMVQQQQQQMQQIQQQPMMPPQYQYDVDPFQQQQGIQMQTYADSYESSPAKKRKKEAPSFSSTTGKSSINLLDDSVEFGSGLTFGQLGKFTSKQLEEIVLKERQKRILTTEEEYKIKKVRRNVKNRESAQLSRKRKMQITSLMLDHIKYLEGQLTTANIPFRSWKSICSSSDVSSPIMAAAAATAIPVQLHAPGTSSSSPSGKMMTSGKRNGAALLFAVVLFSVGIFFTFISTPKSKQMFTSETVLSTPFVLLPDVDVPSPSAIMAAPTPKHAAARTMKQIEMSSSALISKEGISPKMPSATESPSDDSSSNGNHRLLGNTPSDLNRISIAGVQPKIVNPQPWCAKDNISYLFCNDVKRYDPPQIQDPSSSTIGILVPSSSLDKVAVAPVPQESKRLGVHQSISNSVSDDLVEITCSVRDVTVIPRQGFRMVPKSSY